MFKKLVFFLVLSFALLGCGGSKGGDGGSTNTEDSVVATIELKADKTTITADGTETVTLSAVVKDKDNVIITGANIDYYEGTTKLTGNTFKTTTAGTYNITAKSGTITSNVLTITANEKKLVPTTILLTADKTTITADGTEIVTLSTIVKDQNNSTMSGVTVDYYEGATKLTGNTFKTTTAGNYNLTAKVGNLTSNIIAVTANIFQLQSISVKTSPTKNKYYVGDTALDISGLVIEGKYSNNSVKTESISLSNITGFDTSSVGVKTLTVKINEKTATFNVTVLDEFIKSNFILKKKVDFLELNEYSAEIEVYDSSVYKIIFSGTDLISVSEVTLINRKTILNSVKIGQPVKEITLTAVDVNGKQIGNSKKVVINN